jgi:hypothetical protein
MRTNGSLLTLVCWCVLSAMAAAAPVITVTSPQSGWTVNSPVYFAASATSPGCTKGISAMRIYVAPHVAVFSIDAHHFETFVNLKPGTYNTLVQAWDNCGEVAKAEMKVVAPVSGGVTVYSPANHTAAASPLRFVAGAASPACARGVSEIRIYTAPGVEAYTGHGNHLDVVLNLAPAVYDAAVQARDNCGGVFTVPVTATVKPPPSMLLSPTASQTSAPLGR